MNIRVSMLRDIIKLKEKSKVLNNCCVLYSTWTGYKLQDEPTMKFLEKMDELKIPVIDRTYFTDTGDRECIKKVIDVLKPEVIIPIHGEQPEKIKELTDKAVILQDGEIYEVK